MTFTETIYEKISQINYISTDEFSKEWLGQSRSYYSSNKVRQIEASIPALVCLMNKLTEHEQALRMTSPHQKRTSHQFLLKAAAKYLDVATEVGEEITKRSLKTNLANNKVKEMLYKIIERVNEPACSSAQAIIIGF